MVLAYNEEACVADFLHTMLAYLDGLPGEHEIVVVDDGSQDQTAPIVEALSAEDQRIRLIKHGVNRGMGAGMRTGYGAAQKDYAVVFPADGQIKPQELDKLLPHLPKATIVSSIYTRRPSERYRVVISTGLRLLMRAAIGLSFQLEGIYLFPVPFFERVGLDNVRAETFFFSFELISRAMQEGASVYVGEIMPSPRMAGDSKVANLKRIRRVADELLAFRGRLKAEGRL